MQRRTDRSLPSALEAQAHKSAIDDEDEACTAVSGDRCRVPVPAPAVVAGKSHPGFRPKPGVAAEISDDSDEAEGDHARGCVGAAVAGSGEAQPSQVRSVVRHTGWSSHKQMRETGAVHPQLCKASVLDMAITFNV